MPIGTRLNATELKAQLVIEEFLRVGEVVQARANGCHIGKLDGKGISNVVLRQTVSSVQSKADVEFAARQSGEFFHIQIQIYTKQSVVGKPLLTPADDITERVGNEEPPWLDAMRGE